MYLLIDACAFKYKGRGQKERERDRRDAIALVSLYAEFYFSKIFITNCITRRCAGGIAQTDRSIFWAPKKIIILRS